jgi:hypothetical protein
MPFLLVAGGGVLRCIGLQSASAMRQVVDDIVGSVRFAIWCALATGVLAPGDAGPTCRVKAAWEHCSCRKGGAGRSSPRAFGHRQPSSNGAFGAFEIGPLDRISQGGQHSVICRGVRPS